MITRYFEVITHLIFELNTEEYNVFTDRRHHNAQASNRIIRPMQPDYERGAPQRDTARNGLARNRCCRQTRDDRIGIFFSFLFLFNTFKLYYNKKFFQLIR